VVARGATILTMSPAAPQSRCRRIRWRCS
jgi:hypothetical protein